MIERLPRPCLLTPIAFTSCTNKGWGACRNMLGQRGFAAASGRSHASPQQTGKRMKKIAFALLAVSLAGCAARGPAFTEAPPPGTKALVYIYRPYNQWVSTQDAGFDANGKRVGFLDPGGYTYFHAPAGHYDIRQFWPLGLWTIQAPGLWRDLHVSA